MYLINNLKVLLLPLIIEDLGACIRDATLDKQRSRFEWEDRNIQNTFKKSQIGNGAISHVYRSLTNQKQMLILLQHLWLTKASCEEKKDIVLVRESKLDPVCLNMRSFKLGTDVN